MQILQSVNAEQEEEQQRLRDKIVQLEERLRDKFVQLEEGDLDDYNQISELQSVNANQEMELQNLQRVNAAHEKELQRLRDKIEQTEEGTTRCNPINPETDKSVKRKSMVVVALEESDMALKKVKIEKNDVAEELFDVRDDYQYLINHSNNQSDKIDELNAQLKATKAAWNLVL